MLDKLFELGLIELPESKDLEEVKRVCDPKYNTYHGIIRDPLTKCKAFKEQVMQVTKRWKNHAR